AVVGGPSGSGMAAPRSLLDLAARLGVSDILHVTPPVPQADLADWYRAADVTVVPSYSESFGLVAVESQACGTPVVGSAVGGLRTAVANGVSGLLVDGHDPADYADVLGRLLAQPRYLGRLAAAARGHASAFGWPATAARMLDVYADAMAEQREPVTLAAGR
ncbi:MAG: glycosyltransferase, partial [Actinomycetes bacterium]